MAEVLAAVIVHATGAMALGPLSVDVTAVMTIVRISPEGMWEWYSTMEGGGSNTDVITDTDVGAGGRVALCGFFTDALTLGSYTLAGHGAGPDDADIVPAVLSVNGTREWGVAAGTCSGHNKATGVAWVSGDTLAVTGCTVQGRTPRGSCRRPTDRGRAQGGRIGRRYEHGGTACSWRTSCTRGEEADLCGVECHAPLPPTSAAASWL